MQLIDAPGRGSATISAGLSGFRALIAHQRAGASKYPHQHWGLTNDVALSRPLKFPSMDSVFKIVCHMWTGRFMLIPFALLSMIVRLTLSTSTAARLELSPAGLCLTEFAKNFWQRSTKCKSKQLWALLSPFFWNTAEYSGAAALQFAPVHLSRYGILALPIWFDGLTVGRRFACKAKLH